MITRADLILAFPEFNDTDLYPVSQVDFFIAQAYRMLPARRFDEQLDYGVMLFVAHYLILSAKRILASRQSGGVANNVIYGGPMQSKSIGSVSASYDTKLTTIEGAGPWNATIYGQQFYQWAIAYGTGPMYVVAPQNYGAPVAPGHVFPDGATWSGYAGGYWRGGW